MLGERKAPQTCVQLLATLAALTARWVERGETQVKQQLLLESLKMEKYTSIEDLEERVKSIPNAGKSKALHDCLEGFLLRLAMDTTLYGAEETWKITLSAVAELRMSLDVLEYLRSERAGNLDLAKSLHRYLTK